MEGELGCQMGSPGRLSCLVSSLRSSLGHPWCVAWPPSQKASFVLAGSKVVCSWASKGSRVLWLGAALGFGRKGSLQRDHWQVSLLQDGVEPCQVCNLP